MELRNIYRQRRHQNWQRFLKYSKYIFNDHLMVALFFLLGALAFQYQNWVKTLSGPHYIAEIIWVIGIVLFILIQRPKTYIQYPDTMFLLPKESQFNQWFKESFKWSLIRPTLGLIFILLASYPFFYSSLAWQVGHLLLFGGMIWCYVLLYVLNQIEQLKYTPHSKYAVSLITLISLICSVFLYFNNSFFLALGLCVLWEVIFYIWIGIPFRSNVSQWQWEKAVTDENKRRETNDKLLALFVDIKPTGVKVKRRRYLDFLLWSRQQGKNPYTFLFKRHFWRDTQFMPIWTRLTLIGSLLLLLLPNNYLTISIIVIIQYFSHYQVLPLYRHFQQHPMLRTAPIPFELKKQGFFSLLFQLMVIQVVCYWIVSVIHYGCVTGTMISLTWVATVLMLNIWWKRKLTKM